MPKIKDAAAALAFKESFTSKQLKRIPQFRQIVDGKLTAPDVIKSIIAADYQKGFVPYQNRIVAQTLYDLTNIMASNSSEIRFRARSTDPETIADVQEHEHGHEALDPILFPISVVKRMYSFLTDGFTIVALDVTPKPGLLEGFADRDKLKKYAESDDEDGSPAEQGYRRAYQRTDERKTSTERHEDAYDKATTEAMLADGCGLRVRVIDPETFRGFQTDDDPARFAIGIEYGQKQLNPLLTAFAEWGVKKNSQGILVIEGAEEEPSGSYKALGAGIIADIPSNIPDQSSDEYVEYTQIRTCEETLILIEHPKKMKDSDGQPGILIRIPNLFGGISTGYYLIEGDVKLRSGDLEDRYDPPLAHLMNEAQHYVVTRNAFQAMAFTEATTGLYQLDENDGAGAIEPHDPTQETKSVSTEDNTAVPIAAGEVKRIPGFAQKLEGLLDHALAQMHEARPTDIWGGTGSSSETGIAIARRETALLTKLSPHQASRATVCKLIHMDVDRYVAETGSPIKLAYLPPEATSDTKPEVREITPESAVLPMDMDYTIGSDTPESKAARKQMAAQDLALGAIGMTDYREDAGYKDPNALEQRVAVDRLMTLLLGGSGIPSILDQTFTSVMQGYAQATLEREFGPKPAPPPQILGPDGQPLAPSAQATQISPEQVQNPQGALQSVPEVNNIPVVPGGAPAIA